MKQRRCKVVAICSRACQGSLTVFLAMIFLFVVAFLGALFMSAQHQLIKTDVRRDLDAAGFSVLAEYDRQWIREYGLYVVSEKQLEEGIRFYLGENAEHSWGSYTVHDVSITEMQSLQDLSVLQQQITRFMKWRGVLDFMQEAAEMLMQIQEKEKEAAETVDWQDTQRLQWVQTLYAQIVTDLEGVRADGLHNPYSINHLLQEAPSYEELRNAVMQAEPDEKALAILEKAYDALDQVGALCEEAQQLMKEMQEEVSQLKNPEIIPVSEASLTTNQQILEKNKRLCKEAAEALRAWIHWLSTEEEGTIVHAEAIQTVQQLLQYDRSILFPYEYREAKDKNFDFGMILAYMKGYTEQVSDVAPDQEYHLGLNEGTASGDQEVAEIKTDSSFQELFLTAEYALGIFQNFREALAKQEGEAPVNLRGEVKENRFFTNEIEYLITGKENEYQNVEGSRQKLVLVRMILNMAYLLSDTEKRMEIEAIANTVGGILIPGIGNGIVFGMVLTIWSWGEAITDYRTLIKGGGVPLWKTDESWQTDLNTLLSMNIEQTESLKNGLSYEQYIRLLLYMVGEEKLLLRIQNLLYLNHQRRSMEEFVTGFGVTGRLEGMGLDLTFSGKYAYEMDE